MDRAAHRRPSRFLSGLFAARPPNPMQAPAATRLHSWRKLISQSKNDPAVGPTASQSIGAQLGHQPTPESVRRAEIDSRAGIDAILSRAKAHDEEGKTTECMELVGTAKLKFE